MRILFKIDTTAADEALERVAGAVEREILKMAGWSETKLQTLWFHPEHSGMFSVDEALEIVRNAY